MRARWYAPGTATFRSRDTYSGDLNRPVSLNRYTYAGNNPTRYWDPNGRNPCQTADICGGKVVNAFGERVTPGTATSFASNVTVGGTNEGGGNATAHCIGKSDCRPMVSTDMSVAPSSVEAASECFFAAACTSDGALVSGASYSSGYIDPFPGAGQLQLNLFIPQDELSWVINPKGDGRTFDDEATLEDSLASVFIDFETGYTVAAYNESCRNGVLLGIGGTYCQDAFETGLTIRGGLETPDCGGLSAQIRVRCQVSGERYSDDYPGKNHIVIFQESPNQLVIGLEGEISVGLWGSPSINSVTTLNINNRGIITAQKTGNEFPAYEVYQHVNGGLNEAGRFEARTHGYLFDGPVGHVFRFTATNDYFDWMWGG